MSLLGAFVVGTAVVLGFLLSKWAERAVREGQLAWGPRPNTVALPKKTLN